MNMKDIDAQVDIELEEEVNTFVKNILKQKRQKLTTLNKELGNLMEEISSAEDEYEKMLNMSVDKVYNKYKPESLLASKFIFSDQLPANISICGE